LLILGQHAIDLGLLQHDLGDEDVIRVTRPPPWEIAAVPFVPAEEPAPEPLAIARRRKIVVSGLERLAWRH